MKKNKSSHVIERDRTASFIRDRQKIVKYIHKKFKPLRYAM